MLQSGGDNIQLMPINVMTLVPSFTFQCAGFVSQWTVVLSGEDQHSFDINFLVWRPSADNDFLTLVGQNLFSVEYKSSRSVYVLQPKPSNRIHVKVGDVIGVYTFYTDDINAQYGIQLMSVQDNITIYHKHGLDTSGNETFQVSFLPTERSSSVLPMITAEIGT